jgi:hypothetical protein
VAKFGPESTDDAVAEAKQRLCAMTSESSEIVLLYLAMLSKSWPNSDPETLRLLATLVAAIAPRHVIEFGCGVTTELLARLAFDHGRMAMTCFEHDPWAAAEFLGVAGAETINYRWFSFCICPLVARRCGGQFCPVYDDRMSAPTVPYPADLVVINGPPEVLGGRGGMMHQALKYAQPGTIVLALNARLGEEAMFEAWLHDLASRIEFMPPGYLDRHLAFVIREPWQELFTLEEPFAQMREACHKEAGNGAK